MWLAGQALTKTEAGKIFFGWLTLGTFVLTLLWWTTTVFRSRRRLVRLWRTDGQLPEGVHEEDIQAYVGVRASDHV